MGCQVRLRRLDQMMMTMMMMILIMMMMTMMMTTRMMFINELIEQSIEIRFLTAAAARMRIRKAKPTSGHLEPTSGHLDGERMSERENRPSTRSNTKVQQH